MPVAVQIAGAIAVPVLMFVFVAIRLKMYGDVRIPSSRKLEPWEKENYESPIELGLTRPDKREP
jgi:hypothetical protein